MRFGFIGSRPLHLVPSSSFPLFTHLWFSLFFHVLLSSCLVISSLCSFARTLVPALVCVRALLHTFSTQDSGRPGLYNEVGFIGCPCALGFSSIATTHLFVPSCPPPHVFILLPLPREHLHIRPSLSSFCLPSGRRVCVCPL